MKRFITACMLVAACAAPVAASAQDWATHMRRGDEARRLGDDTAAMGHYRAAARLGAAAAMNDLAILYGERQGDALRGLMWALAAAKHEHAIDFGLIRTFESRLSREEILRARAMADRCARSGHVDCGDAVPSTPPAAQVGESCRVADPTGTPLNARTSPNGKIVGQIANGAQVSVLDRATDANSRPWAFVRSLASGATRGWVFASYLVCR